MMSSNRTILSRPRTRIYDSNYNIGESYYKSTLDNLDRKYYGRTLSPLRHSSALDVAERHARAFADEDIEDSRRKASSRIREANVFDSKGSRLRRGIDYEAEDGVNDETALTLQRIRASKKVSYMDDVDLENTSGNLRTQRLLDRSEKILDSVGLNENSASKKAIEKDYSYQRKSVKSSYDADSDNLTKWTARAIKDTPEDSGVSSAAIRARQSRAKIEDIDEEMAAMQEKQAMRERRVARLKQLVAECDSETVDDNGVATSVTVTEKKVRF